MSVKVNEKGYVDAAFFTEVKVVRIGKRSDGEYVFIAFGLDGSDEYFEVKSKSPKNFLTFVKHKRQDVI